ncbi:PX domain-containing protein like [Verticillium longisporum]|nr:PX domain-containing protein like [Verticillium longisporum]
MASNVPVPPTNGDAVAPGTRAGAELPNSSTTSLQSYKAPPSGQTLTGKQEHYLKRELISDQVKFEISELNSPTALKRFDLKRELISDQVKYEISELNSPTALKRFGAPFKSDYGEVSPLESELPILRYIFVHHVRDFPFLDKAREKEFWQDKLQVFLESFAMKNISSSEDRLEETKRRKLALKSQKLVELMMVSGVKTSSGFEERIRFSEIEVVDSNAIDTGVMHTLPEGNYINGWDVNVAGVHITQVKKTIRHHKHAEFLLRIKRKGELEFFVGRRYGDFSRLYKRLRIELPGKVLPTLPKKNKSDTTTSSIFSSMTSGSKDDDASSFSSVSTQMTNLKVGDASGQNLTVHGHRRPGSIASTGRGSPRTSTDDRTRALLGKKSHRRPGSIASTGRGSPRTSTDDRARALLGKKSDTVTLWRESQRVSLRAFIRSLLANPQIAQTKAMEDFLTKDQITPTDEDVDDIMRRKALDEQRMEEQKKFYEIARKRAAELDIYMEEFRREIVERNGLTTLFKEIREKETIGDLSIQYRKFAEWLRIEIAATIYHLFLAEDNSPELFAQAKRIHSLIPYTVMKNVIRIANPAAVMSGVLDIFLAQPFVWLLRLATRSWWTS